MRRYFIAINPWYAVGNTSAWGFLLVATLLVIPLAAAEVTTSQLGYHPEQYKQVVVYTNASADSFELLVDNASVYSGELVAATCQGEQACLVGDFSEFSQEGVYTAYAANSSSKEFRIDSQVYADALQIYAEFFNALRLQKSNYHADHHAAADPPLPMTADGSFLMTTDQAALTLIRLGQAYERNPSALAFSVYEQHPDLAVHIKEYADYLAGLQDHDGRHTMPKGWYYNFDCPKNYAVDIGQHNEEQDDCLLWDGNSDSKSVVYALTAYAHALPAITAVYGEEEAESLLKRALLLDAYIQQHHTQVHSPGNYGSALFILYDFTNETDYLTRAYDLRESVSPSLDMEWTAGEELYWHEYIKHEATINELGEYAVGGEDPREFFKKQTGDNWHRISAYGDYATASSGRNFQQSRPMLLAVVQAEFTNQHLNYSDATRVSESQIAWLTGQNRVHWWEQGMQSRSFIFGIGEAGVNQHVRLVGPTFFEEENQWLNGKKHIDGWIVGAYDNSGDGVLEYDDAYDSWRYTESTNHMAALGVLAFAQLDARHNDQQPLTRPQLSWEQPVLNDTNKTPSPDTCYENLRAPPATCSGGEIFIDQTDGCRRVICITDHGSIEVQACNKPDGEAKHFEMTRESISGEPPELCLADACMQEEAFLKSSEYPICPYNDTQPEGTASLEVVWSTPTQVLLREEVNSSVTITNAGNASFEGGLSYYFNDTKQEAPRLVNISLAPSENHTALVSLVTQLAGTYNHSIRSADGAIIYAEQELVIVAQEEPEETASLEVTWSVPVEIVLGEETNSSLVITNVGNSSFSGALSYYFNDTKQEASSLANITIQPKANYTTTLALVNTPVGSFMHSIKDANATTTYAQQEITVTAPEEPEDTTLDETTTTPRRGGGGGGGFTTGATTPPPSTQNTSTTSDAQETATNQSDEDEPTNTTQEELINQETPPQTTTPPPPTRNLLTGAATATTSNNAVAGWIVFALALVALAGLVLIKKLNYS